MADVTNKFLAAYLRAARASAGSRLLRRVIVLSCVAIVALTSGWPATAQVTEDANLLEYRVKAAFLYRFAGYVGWPPAAFVRPDTPVTIAVIAADGLAAELEKAVIGRTVSDRMVAVKRIKSGDSLTGVHVLFIGKAEAARLSSLVQTAQTRSILTVTEFEGALRQGSVINFIIAEQRVRFEISLDSAEKSGLKLSSRLLAVAQQVLTGAP
jgi:hypothetical protein